MTGHADDFVLLRCAVGDLEEGERASVVSHVADCPDCSAAVDDLERLDAELLVLASEGAFAEKAAPVTPGDPFRHRPRERRTARTAGEDPLTPVAVAASERGIALQAQILEAVRRRPDADLPEFPLSDGEHRFALLYALQQAGREIAEDPVGALGFARAVLERLDSEPAAPTGPPPAAERMVPQAVLLAQAHLLAAMACMWTKDFARARSSLVAAYRSFARGGGDETSLAHVELVEAQRRAFVHEGAGALILARRAQATFEARGLEDVAARAIGARGLAYSDLGREEEAVGCFRQALPVYERHELWSNYVGCLNSIATSLTSLGRVDEARREYARALRRFSQERHRYWLGYIRTGLAETLFAAGRYSEAAAASARAAQVFRACGLRANAYIATLLEIESRARGGSLERARHRLDLLERRISRDRALDPTVLHDLADALSGADLDFERLAALRLQAEDVLRQVRREETG
jgi:tetratricopeptide (TPR) repeat protein